MKQQPVKHYKRQALWKPPVKDRVYLDVPFDDKDAAKMLGAWWDSEARSWYITTTKLAKFPQFCIWMYPGEQKLWAKKRVEWLQQNDPGELVNIDALVRELKSESIKKANEAASNALSLAMAK